MDPEVAAAIGKLFGPNPPPAPAAGDVETRRALLEGLFGLLSAQGPQVDDVNSKDFTTKAPDGHEIGLRWYTKNESPLPGSAVYYTHGGGMICLKIKDYDAVAKRYVSRTGVPLMLVEYRLAPEAKAPTQTTDAYAGLQYLVSNVGSLGVDPSRIAIMGDSAGGGITASLAHYIKLKGGPAVKKQILIYPMLDDRNLTPDENIAPYCTWTYDDNKTGWSALLGDKLGTDSVDPIEAAGRMTVKDAKALPPCYMDVGELDAFRDEDIEYVQTLTKAGVECEFHLTPGVPHAYDGMAPESEAARMTWENRFRVIKAL